MAKLDRGYEDYVEGRRATGADYLHIYVENADAAHAVEFVHDPTAGDKPGLAAWGQYLTLPSGRYRVEIEIPYRRG